MANSYKEENRPNICEVNHWTLELSDFWLTFCWCQHVKHIIVLTFKMPDQWFCRNLGEEDINPPV